jgi:hypothetical protein
MNKADIKDYPIFRVGMWNKMEFAIEDLQQIAATWNELKDIHHVPLKLGHNDQQPLTDGQPALGWIRNVRVVDGKLLADFTDMPVLLKELIKKRKFRSVSIELVIGAEYEGKKIKYLLDAVAILGADQPAVRALPDLSMYLASQSHGDVGGRRVTFKGQVNRTVFTSRNEPTGGSKMDEDEVKKLIATSVAAAVAPLQTQIDGQHGELTKWKTKFSEEENKRIAAETEAKSLRLKDEERAKDAAKVKVTMARKGVNDLLEVAVKAKKITPAMRDRAVKMFGVNDDVRVIGIDLDEVKEFFSLSKEDKVIIDGDESSTRGGGGGEGDGDPSRKHKDVFLESEHRVRVARQQDAKLTYAQAMRHVFSLDPALHREYLNTSPPVHAASGGN